MPHSYISDSDRKGFLVFILTAYIFFMIICAGFEIALYHLGETIPYRKVFERQMYSRELFLPKYTNVGSAYKEIALARTKPKIIALGTSRIMSLSSEHFAPQAGFYNAAIDASSSQDIDGMRKTLEGLPSSSGPHTVIIGIDPWLFNPNYPSNQSTFRNHLLNFVRNQPVLDKFYFGYEMLARRISIYSQFVGEKSDWFSQLKSRRGIGLNAKESQAGFSLDGSMQYPLQKEDDQLKSLKEWQGFLAKDHYRFASSQNLDNRELLKFRDFLEFCRDRRIEVIGVLLPFREDLWNALQTERAPYFTKFRQEMNSLLEEEGFLALDFSDPISLGLTQNDFIDAYHMKASGFEKICQILKERKDVPKMIASQIREPNVVTTTN